MRADQRPLHRRIHGESARNVHHSLPGGQPRLAGVAPYATQRRDDRHPPVRGERPRQRLGLIVAPLPPAPRRQRHGDQTGPLALDVGGPPEGGDPATHRDGEPGPALVLEGVDQRRRGAAVPDPRRRPDGAHPRRQQRAPGAGRARLGLPSRMPAPVAAGRGERLHARPAEAAGRAGLTAERTAAADTGPRQGELAEGVEQLFAAREPRPQARRARGRERPRALRVRGRAHATSPCDRGPCRTSARRRAPPAPPASRAHRGPGAHWPWRP